MSEAERLLRRAGATRIPNKRHKVYVLGRERFTLHMGGKPNWQELIYVRKKLRHKGRRTDD